MGWLTMKATENKNIKFSNSKKLNAALSVIYEDLKAFDTDTGTGESNGAIMYYYKKFNDDKDASPDYNIAQYGNLFCYYYQLYIFYKNCGYKTTDKFSPQKILTKYRRHVGYIVRKHFIK